MSHGEMTEMKKQEQSKRNTRWMQMIEENDCGH